MNESENCEDISNVYYLNINKNDIELIETNLNVKETQQVKMNLMYVISYKQIKIEGIVDKVQKKVINNKSEYAELKCKFNPIIDQFKQLLMNEITVPSKINPNKKEMIENIDFDSALRELDKELGITPIEVKIEKHVYTIGQMLKIYFEHKSTLDEHIKFKLNNYEDMHNMIRKDFNKFILDLEKAITNHITQNMAEQVLFSDQDSVICDDINAQYLRAIYSSSKSPNKGNFYTIKSEEYDCPTYTIEYLMGIFAMHKNEVIEYCQKNKMEMPNDLDEKFIWDELSKEEIKTWKVIMENILFKLQYL